MTDHAEILILKSDGSKSWEIAYHNPHSNTNIVTRGLLDKLRLSCEYTTILQFSFIGSQLVFDLAFSIEETEKPYVRVGHVMV